MAEEQSSAHEDENNFNEQAQEEVAAGAAADSEPSLEDTELTVDDILNAAADASVADADAPATESEAGGEYLEDLRRVTAEFANYRKRTEENREVERQRATGVALSALLPVLDDLDRAEKHGDLADGSAFAAIAQKIRGTTERLGLVAFGEAGEDFDPKVHEAITQVPNPALSVAQVLEVVERGYRIGDVELRAAKVVVAVPEDG